MTLRAMLALLLTTCSFASADTITFDELGTQPNVFIETNPLRMQYAALSFTGPTALNGGAILNQLGGFGINARSGQHFLAFNRLANVTMLNGGNPRDPETITFSSLMQTVSIYAAGGSAVGSFRMEAFGGSSQLLGTTTVVAGATWGLLSLSSAAGIRSVVLTEFGGQESFVYDDLSFTPVPAPGSLGMLALGGVIVARRRRGV